MCFVAWQQRKVTKTDTRHPQACLSRPKPTKNTPSGPKVRPYFAWSQCDLFWSRCDQHFSNCRLVLRIATPLRPTQFWVSQWCRGGVAMRPRSLFQVLQWCRNGVALRPMFQIVPTTCPTHAHFEFLAQIQPLDVKSRAKMTPQVRATCLSEGELEIERERPFWRLKEELGGRRVSMGA